MGECLRQSSDEWRDRETTEGRKGQVCSHDSRRWQTSEQAIGIQKILWGQSLLSLTSVLDLELAVFLWMKICLIMSYHLEKSRHANSMHSCIVQTHYLLLTGSNLYEKGKGKMVSNKLFKFRSMLINRLSNWFSFFSFKFCPKSD